MPNNLINYIKYLNMIPGNGKLKFLYEITVKSLINHSLSFGDTEPSSVLNIFNFSL